MMKQKRGQFYLILAVIIIVIVTGLVTTMNYAKKLKRPVKFYDLSEDYEAETTSIIDYGVFTAEESIEEKVKDFTEKFLEYAKEKDPNLQLAYIYGDKEKIVVENYAIEEGIIITSRGEEQIIAGAEEAVESKITIEYGGKEFVRDVSEKMKHFKDVKESVVDPGKWVKVEIAGVLHTFDLKSGEAFYYVVATKGVEVHVEKSEGT